MKMMMVSIFWRGAYRTVFIRRPVANRRVDLYKIIEMLNIPANDTIAFM